MITATEYRKQHTELLNEYEARVRKWLVDCGEKEIAKKIPFYRDGVVNPDKWFAEGNHFRPLFILKEVSMGIERASELDQYLAKWGNQKTVEFVENPFEDIRHGKLLPWRRIAALAKGLEEVFHGAKYYEYSLDKFAYTEGGEVYTGMIEGYNREPRTANTAYHNAIENIAVLDVKKVGGGKTANSEISLATKHYSEHIMPFVDLICREIDLIKPTLIICCSHEYYTSQSLAEVQRQITECAWIYGYHPTMSSTENFYKKPLLAYRAYLDKG